MLPAAHDSASAQLLGQLAEPGHGPALNQRLQNASHGRHCSTRTPERQARSCRRQAVALSDAEERISLSRVGPMSQTLLPIVV
jgi:hypothetical protein